MERRLFNLETARGLALTGMLAGSLLAWLLLAWQLWTVALRGRKEAGPAQPPMEAELAELQARNLHFPVEGIARVGLSDSFQESRGARTHLALDIPAPRDTAVRAVDDGTIARLMSSGAGGISIYQFDPAGRYCYYYAHLARYAPGLREGQTVGRGQVIGYVGTTGNAPEEAPHLHFAIFRLEDPNRWWSGRPVNPYPLLR